MNDVLPDSIADRYIIKKRIGEGGMGYVYLAEDVQLMREVAIKTIRPSLLDNEDVQKRIERECKMHAAIRIHPHIVGLYDKVSDGNNIFLIMEYVEGRTLSELIASAKSADEEIPSELIVETTIQVLDALSCIHRHEILHRDIKPSNIIVGGLDSNTAYAKLMDFGIAREVLEDDNVTKLTMVNAGSPGTPAYMSPERIDSATYGDISPATDLYAVGVILYEMYHLDPPFHGTMTEVFSGHLARDLDLSRLDNIPEAMRNVILKALQKQTAARYQNADEFAADLKVASQSCNGETLLSTSFEQAATDQTILNASYSPVSNPSISKERKSIFRGMSLLVLISAFMVLMYVFLPFKSKISSDDSSPAEKNENVSDEQVSQSSAPPQTVNSVQDDNRSERGKGSREDDGSNIRAVGTKSSEQERVQVKVESVSHIPVQSVDISDSDDGGYSPPEEKDSAMKAFDAARAEKEQLAKEKEEQEKIRRVQQEKEERNRRSESREPASVLPPKVKSKQSNKYIVIPQV